MKTHYFLKRNFNQFNNIFENGYKNRHIRKCGFKEIMKELENYNKNAENYFKKSLSEFLNFLASEDNLEKIFIVSFPHRKHLDNTYKVNVSDYIDDTLIVNEDKRIQHINMSKIDLSNFDKNEIFKPLDLASHLKNDYHSKIFMKNIVSKIEN